MTPRFLTDADEMITFSPKSILDAGTFFATFRDRLFSTVQP
jgi:hypothetical protein